LHHDADDTERAIHATPAFARDIELYEQVAGKKGLANLLDLPRMPAHFFAARKKDSEILVRQMRRRRALTMGLAMDRIPTRYPVGFCRQAPRIRGRDYEVRYRGQDTPSGWQIPFPSGSRFTAPSLVRSRCPPTNPCPIPGCENISPAGQTTQANDSTQRIEIAINPANAIKAAKSDMRPSGFNTSSSGPAPC
jgi:hypothetical protein